VSRARGAPLAGEQSGGGTVGFYTYVLDCRHYAASLPLSLSLSVLRESGGTLIGLHSSWDEGRYDSHEIRGSARRYRALPAVILAEKGWAIKREREN
jgi:hypothetical protein